MEVQAIIELFFNYIIIAMILSTISKFVCEGIIDAWGVSNAWLKRLFVILMNGLLTYYATLVLNQYEIIECVIVMLFTCAGAEALHNAVNRIKKYKDLDNVESLPENTEYIDSEV